jgi:hypothetical protein
MKRSTLVEVHTFYIHKTAMFILGKPRCSVTYTIA